MKRVQIFIFWQGMKQVIECAITGCSDVARQFTDFQLYLPGCVCVKYIANRGLFGTPALEQVI